MTADVATGTGGLDASIGFETLRPENVGTAFNDSLFFFSFFVTAQASMADLIALGTAMAVGACGGPQIAFRGGRIDATGPGPSGVPEPETDIKTTLADFSGAGFNEEDAIGLTACGHTMGGVHHSTFSQVVTESAVGPNNAGCRIAFDDTVASFDIDVVRQYLNGTGNARGASGHHCKQDRPVRSTSVHLGQERDSPEAGTISRAICVNLCQSNHSNDRNRAEGESHCHQHSTHEMLKSPTFHSTSTGAVA